MKPAWKYLVLAVALVVGVTSCAKKKMYPIVPEIGYKGFTPYSDGSADLVINFTDGDGDIGNASINDPTENLFVTYYYKDPLTGKYTPFFSSAVNGPLITGYVVRSPTESYKGKPISGEYSIRLQQYRHSVQVKQLKYVVMMYDNAGNKSNVLTTDEINVP